MFCLCVCMFTTYVSGTHGDQKRVSIGLGSHVPLGRCWELNLHPLEDQPVPLAAEPSLQPSY